MSHVMLPDGGLAEFRRAIEQSVPEDAVRALREAGRRLAPDAETALGRRSNGSVPDLPRDSFWHELARYFEEAGWGHVEHQDVREGIGAAIARDWAESDPNEGRDVPGCHISTGLLAELLTRTAGEPVAVLESNCRSRGDESCRFLFGAPSTLVALHQHLAQGRSLDEALDRMP